MIATIHDTMNNSHDATSRALSLLTELGTKPNLYTVATGTLAGANPHIQSKDLLRPSRCAKHKREIAFLLKDHALNDLKRHAANFSIATAAGHALF